MGIEKKKRLVKIYYRNFIFGTALHEQKQKKNFCCVGLIHKIYFLTEGTPYLCSAPPTGHSKMKYRRISLKRTPLMQNN